MTSNVTLKKIQREHAVWVEQNFGLLDPWQPLVGIAEELGELASAIETDDTPEYFDAIGDVAIFALHYCTLNKWDAQKLYAKADYQPFSPKRLMVCYGKLAHHHLKSTQGIRGDSEFHAQEGRKWMGRLLRTLDTASFDSGLLPVLGEVWQKVVKKRDWKKNPGTGS